MGNLCATLPVSTRPEKRVKRLLPLDDRLACLRGTALQLSHPLNHIVQPGLDAGQYPTAVLGQA
jgi:hypothetical protein